MTTPSERNSLLQSFVECGKMFDKLNERNGPTYCVLNKVQFMALGGSQEAWDGLPDVELSPGEYCGLKYVESKDE